VEAHHDTQFVEDEDCAENHINHHCDDGEQHHQNVLLVQPRQCNAIKAVLLVQPRQCNAIKTIMLGQPQQFNTIKIVL
jgi:hypothetical protein